MPVRGLIVIFGTLIIKNALACGHVLIVVQCTCSISVHAVFFVNKGRLNLLNMLVSVLWSVLKLSSNYLRCGCSFEHFLIMSEIYVVSGDG